MADEKSRMHVHGICSEHHEGKMMVTLGTNAEGRAITLEIGLEDHPALEDKYNDLCRVIETAALTVMLDLVGMGSALPDALPDVPVLYPPCRICNVKLESNVWVAGRPYCVQHAPDDTAPA
jgi:hypothetical protein